MIKKNPIFSFFDFKISNYSWAFRLFRHKLWFFEFLHCKYNTINKYELINGNEIIFFNIPLYNERIRQQEEPLIRKDCQ